MERGAKIGVHSRSVRGDNIGVFAPENIGSDRRQKYHEKFLSDMGINPDFYVFTREAADPQSIHILTSQDIKRFKLLSDGECQK